MTGLENDSLNFLTGQSILITYQCSLIVNNGNSVKDIFIQKENKTLNNVVLFSISFSSTVFSTCSLLHIRKYKHVINHKTVNIQNYIHKRKYYNYSL